MTNKTTVFVCDCEETIPLDRAALTRALDTVELSARHTQLCKAEIDGFAAVCGKADRLLVACTQEHQTFAEKLDELEFDTPLQTVNIREQAGWSKEAKSAGPKIAALLQLAEMETPQAPTIEMSSAGVCLIYGKPEVALEAAKRLEGRLTVSVLLTEAGGALPLGYMDLMIAHGRIAAATGHLGAFEINVDNYAAVKPSAKDAFSFDTPRNGAAAICDLILDVSGGAPLFPAHQRRDGYVRVDPDDPVALHKALFDLVDLVGEFEKVRYVDFNAKLCAHSRSRITGCTRCLDVCPAAAIAPDGDTVSIDPYLCGGCGGCNSVCPTGAASYAYPNNATLLEQIRMLLGAYTKAGGKRPVLLIHDDDHGRPLIEAMARHGRGLPAAVLPFQVNEVTQIGADIMLSALAYGAERMFVLTPTKRRDEISGLASQAAIVETIMTGLGYDSGLINVLVEDDPDTVEAALYDRLKPHHKLNASQFLPQPQKRTNLRSAGRHLHEHAPSPVDTVRLAPGAPFGAVKVDTDGCTLCLACVSACPTGALTAGEDRPELGFDESACIQCGLCKNTCPESVIALEPQFNFLLEAGRRIVLNEEEPYECISCGKPFAAKSTIDKMLETLGDKHWMFKGDAMERLKMCEDCRITAQFNADDNPFKTGERPKPRTTEDYLSGLIGDDADD
ncbi:MAG: 4Fe-4S binding protein [Alphaproteobacteria bacterium]